MVRRSGNSEISEKSKYSQYTCKETFGNKTILANFELKIFRSPEKFWKTEIFGI